MRRISAAALTAAALLVAAGCGSAHGSDALVVYTRDGGIAGEHTRLMVTAAGSATLDSRVGARRTAWTRQIPTDRLAALRSALDSAHIGELAARHSPAHVCDDCFTDTVAYGGHSVSVQGASVPASLSPALQLLDDLASAA